MISCLPILSGQPLDIGNRTTLTHLSSSDSLSADIRALASSPEVPEETTYYDLRYVETTISIWCEIAFLGIGKLFLDRGSKHIKNDVD